MTTEEYIKSKSADLDKLGLPAPLNRKQVTDILATGFSDGREAGRADVKAALTTSGIGQGTKTPDPVPSNASPATPVTKPAA